MTKPTISVCLPVYNGGTYLAESIESALGQSFSDFELLIFDDGSQDESLDVCNEYARQDLRIKVWRSTGSPGLFANYNCCMRQARGEFIKPFAQDDILFPEMLAKTVQILQQNADVMLVSTARNWIDENGKDISSSVKSPKAVDFVPVDCPISGTLVISKSLNPIVNFIGEPVTVLFRTSSLGDGFDESLHHIGDLEYWIRLLTTGAYYSLSETLCSYRLHQNAASKRNWQELHVGTDVIKVGRRHKVLLEQLGIPYADCMDNAVKSIGAGIAQLNAANLNAMFENSIELGNQTTLTKQEQELLEENKLLKELALHALKSLGQEITLSKVNQQFDLEIARLERKLSHLLSSRSWRYTKVLRDMKSLLKKNMQHYFHEPVCMNSKIDSSTLDFTRQNIYVTYLEELIETVLSSYSWRITRILRVFDEVDMEEKSHYLHDRDVLYQNFQ